MAIQNKSFMNFLGGEVSPSAYKRLDMAGNAKWFETAKNIWFGTTGDFHNRRGFQYIDKPYSGATTGEKVKLIPFVYNRSESYCIAFYNTSFSILKNGNFLTDSLGSRIFVEHPGLNLQDVDDLSYCQVGDLLYICSKKTSYIYTITRKSDTQWEWNLFDYEIPPMDSINTDKTKTLTFSNNSTYSSVEKFNVVFDKLGLLHLFVRIYVSGAWVNICEFDGQLNSLEQFAQYFNTNQTGSTYIDRVEVSSTGLSFFTVDQNQNNITALQIKILEGSQYEKTYEYSSFNTDEFIWNWTQYTRKVLWRGSKNLNLSSNNEKIKSITANYCVLHFAGYYRNPLRPNAMVVSRESRNFTFSPSATPQDVDSTISSNAILSYYDENFQLASEDGFAYDSSNNCFVIKAVVSADDISISHVPGYTNFGSCFELTKMVTVTPVENDQYFDATLSSDPSVSNKDIFDVSASFNFFADKEVGDIFAVESIYSPTRDGKADENKSLYLENVSTGETITTSFWSNGNWRFVSSGLFAGTVQLQYSYDGSDWFTHRTFSSSIRTENNVSYGTNYNEYGTIQSDDNILLRLKINLTSSTNLTLLLDTESFKNRSYYSVESKNVLNPNKNAIVRCIKYNVGTPAYTVVNVTDTGAPIYEWAESAWSKVNGFPKVVFFYQNRLGFANTINRPYSLWFSKTNDFKDFSTKIEYTDDDPITITALRPTGISEITGIASSKKLFVFTADHEEGIQDEGALTQSNKQLLNFTYYGSEPIETRNISNKIIFVERGGHAVRALTYDYAQENYEALDLTIPYKHLLQNEKIVASEYIPGDYKTYLMLTSIGRLICFKYIPEQKIEACSWFMHAAGRITNVCVVNNVDSYDLYVAVDSSSNKQIEYMKITPYDTNNYLDSYRTFNFENATSSITDTDYFVPGKEYTVFVADKTYKLTADNTCTITLPESTTNCAVGLSYVSEATILPPNLLFQNGTTNYNRKNLFKAHFTYMNSDLFKVGIKGRDGSFKQVYAIEETTFDNPDQSGLNERHFSIQSSYFDQNMLSFIQEEPSPMNITNAEMEIDYGGK